MPPVLGLDGAKNISELQESSTILWMKQLLSKGGYFSGEITGDITDEFVESFNNFKTKLLLGEANLVDANTLAYLRCVAPPHSLSSEHTYRKYAVNPEAGTLTGKTGLIPGGTRIYENEYIQGRIPLTWGEVTHGLTRMPKTHEHLENIYELTLVFASVRIKHADPIAVVSGYRPPDSNIGSITSTHRLGKGMDLAPRKRYYNRLIQVCKSIPAVGGIGIGPHFVHIDIRKRDQYGVPVTWFYR